MKCVVGEYSTRVGIFRPWIALRTGVIWLRFGDFSNGTCESILNSVEDVYLSDVYVQEKRIAVV